MFKYLIILSPLAFAFNASAINFQGTPVTTKADVVVKQDSRITLSAGGVANNIPEDNVGTGQIFKLYVDASEANTKISIAGGSETIINEDGTVYSNAKDDGTKLILQIDKTNTKKVSTDTAYLPAAANQVTGASSLLTTMTNSGREIVIFNGADVPQNVTPGEYVFSFIAQAYTE
ncbi:hypothetical protein LH23_17795 [Cedecea neteri]|uniref:Uncharacterized protein n=1 Tax=Cedecea neteri TaxID=158822 RepID=A0AAN0VUS3_9ENTR|nr:hypothetical protein [Cedecea neteri]AIR62442.1 hypothetical protein LH23_17795 [Cedecea neteri]